MSFNSRFRGLISKLRRTGSTRRGVAFEARTASFRPLLESLEDRCLPSTLTVLNASDSGVSGDGSLRGEILAAHNGDTIGFSVQMSIGTHAILLTHGEILLDKNLSIAGPGLDLLNPKMHGLTVRGFTTRVFEIAAGKVVSIQGLTLANSLQIGDGTPFSAQGGAILNHGTLKLVDDRIAGNMVVGSIGGNAARDAQGGGLYNDQGSVNLARVIFMQNVAVGGDGGVLGGNGQGGGLFNFQGDVSISLPEPGALPVGTVFYQNQARGGVALGFDGTPGVSGNGEGGGLYNDFGSVLLSGKSFFLANAAVGGGNDVAGGVRGSGIGGGLENVAGSVESYGTVFLYNSALAGHLPGSQVTKFDKAPDFGDESGPVPLDVIPGGAYGGGLANQTGKLVLQYGNGAMGTSGGVGGNVARGGSAASLLGLAGGNAYGGGVYTVGGQALLSTIVVGNIAYGGDAIDQRGIQSAPGGTARGGGVYSFETDLSVFDSRFFENGAQGGRGGRGGAATGGQGGLAQGGGLYLNGSKESSYVLNGFFQRNGAVGGDGSANGDGGDGQGGAMFLGSGTVSFTHSTTFVNNLARGGKSSGRTGGNGQGGGLYNDMGNVALDATSAFLPPFFANVALGGEQTGAGRAGDGDGGAVFNATGSLQISNATFSHNGVGAGRWQPAGSGQTGMSDDGGHGGSAAGGAIYSRAGQINLLNVVVSSNLALGFWDSHSPDGWSAQGGGLFVRDGTVIIINSTFDYNRAGTPPPDPTQPLGPGSAGIADGGGLYVRFATVEVTNSTFFHNVAYGTNTGQGGGLRNYDGTVALTNVTIAGNAARTGGGVYVHQLTLVNTLIATNTDFAGDPDDPDIYIDFAGTIDDRGHNLIGNVKSIGAFTGPGDLLGTASLPIDPQLGPLADNGGPTPTLALLSGSPAINAGVTVTDPITGQKLVTDQRGAPRPSGGGFDIGAFEVQTISYPKKKSAAGQQQPFLVVLDLAQVLEVVNPLHVVWVAFPIVPQRLGGMFGNAAHNNQDNVAVVIVLQRSGGNLGNGLTAFISMSAELHFLGIGLTEVQATPLPPLPLMQPHWLEERSLMQPHRLDQRTPLQPQRLDQRTPVQLHRLDQLTKLHPIILPTRQPIHPHWLDQVLADPRTYQYPSG